MMLSAALFMFIGIFESTCMVLKTSVEQRTTPMKVVNIYCRRIRGFYSSSHHIVPPSTGWIFWGEGVGQGQTHRQDSNNPLELSIRKGCICRPVSVTQAVSIGA